MAASGPPRYELLGGRLCLDFCNTRTDRGGAGPDRFHSFADVTGWAWRAGALSAEEAARLTRLGTRNPTGAVAVLERARRLREALRAVFAAIAGERRVGAPGLDVLNAELAAAMARSQVVAIEGGFTWLWAPGGKALDAALWPVARSAADLLTEGPLASLRRCENPNCDWLFLDSSRNRTRRWCDMRVCGNRAKAHRHRQTRLSA
ncbi:MAG: ABATE domain-containing protein [Candidatus Dormibacteraeota bacterium]|nr:ABATE domain-containing protein [Candidatus Dormibacteraeota bacterium]